MAFPGVVLILTYPEYGQANVNLATAYELALAGVHVCIASFASLEPRVTRLQKFVARHHAAGSPDGILPGSVTFRECKGVIPFIDALNRDGISNLTLQRPCGVSGAIQSYSTLDRALFPWTPEEYLAVIESIKEVLATARANVVVVDNYFYPAQDACMLADQKFVMMVPNSSKDIAANLQPRGAALWKYAAPSSGFHFPLKWWQVPLNIYLYVRLVVRITTSVRIKEIRALRKSLGIKSMLAFEFERGMTYICPSLPETDFPLKFIPDNLHLCGPIILPFDPLDKSDPALMKWLDNGPTVMVNLGSATSTDEKRARETAGAFHILLDNDNGTGKNIQVLWKVKASEHVRKVIYEILETEIKLEKVKVVGWLEAEPVSILQHPNIVCTVHHGGANSYFEGIWSGLPHIVLPAWADTYEYASRVELLDIGIFGNKRSSPSVGAEEFGKALVRVTMDGEEANRFRSAARRLKDVCLTKGNGRKLASEIILREMTKTTY